MIRRVLAVALAICFVSSGVVADEPDADRIADAAQSAFRDGVAHRANSRLARDDFRRAAEGYRRLCKTNITIPEFYQACGNAWLLAGDVAQAIVAFQAGLRRFPANEDLRRGLDYARTQVAYERAEDRAGLTPRPESYAAAKAWLGAWGVYAVTLISILGWFLGSRWVATRRTSLLAGAAAALAIAVAVAAACLAEQQRRRNLLNEHRVVVARPTTVYSGDGTAYPPRRESELPAGVEAIIRHRRDSWIQVELADGSLGWLPEGMVIQLPANREQLSR